MPHLYHEGPMSMRVQSAVSIDAIRELVREFPEVPARQIVVEVKDLKLLIQEFDRFKKISQDIENQIEEARELSALILKALGDGPNSSEQSPKNNTVRIGSVYVLQTPDDTAESLKLMFYGDEHHSGGIEVVGRMPSGNLYPSNTILRLLNVDVANLSSDASARVIEYSFHTE